MIVAKLAAVLWGVLLVMGLIAWAVVEAICQGVRYLNHRREHAAHLELGARRGASDG
jgi:hypothetical protein